VKLSRKSKNAVANDRVLKFLFDDETQHIEAVVQALMRNMSYTVKVRYKRAKVKCEVRGARWV